MKKLKTIVTVALYLSISAISQAQDEVRIKIPDKADFTFDGKRIQVESSNTLLGYLVANEINDGTENTFIGYRSGFKNSSGSRNTYIGNNTGYNNLGSDNIFIGYNAGANEEGSDQLYISNSDTNKPLINGDFRNQKLVINDYLDVNKDIQAGGTIKSTFLDVNGSASIYSLNITSPVPSMTFFAPNLGAFRMIFHPSQDRFYMEDDDSDEVLEIKNGDLTLPQYAGNTTTNLGMDANGKMIRSSNNKSVYNRFDFHEKDVYSNYTRLRMGVQFQDGTVVTGLKSYIRDNNTTGSTGVHNTAFVGLYRLHKVTGNELNPEVIFRIDANDTAAGVHEEFTQTTLASTGRDIIDNENYIYLIQTFHCDDCSITQVELLGI